ncbi:MAG TPA: tRNA adenosine(34) deaminase TadA [Polyangia bacterium]
MRELHEEMMRRCLAAAATAAAAGEVPVGALVAIGDQVLGVAHNRRESDHDPTAHAEILAIRTAAAALGSWRLCDATLYVTQEPCPMCAGAIVNARLPRLVFGCLNPKAGAVRTLYALCEDPRLNHRVEVVGGILGEECGARLRRFFLELRAGAATNAPGPDGDADGEADKSRRDGREVEGA